MKESPSDNKALVTRRVNQAIADPAKALAQDWYEDPIFCRRFFDRCEDVALANLPEAVPLAQRAVEMAVSNGDSCLVNFSESLLAHAHLCLWDKFWAGRTLEKNRRSALRCCRRCRSDFFRRLGDLLAEEEKPLESLKAFNRCLKEAGDLSGDALGRVLFPRSVALYFCGQPDLALEDIERVLELISVDSPRGYFLDAVAFIAVYLRGAGPSHAARGLEVLERFLERIHKLPWKDARTRTRWVQAHLQARLGNVSRAIELMEMACRALIKDGLAREIVAGVIDLGQLKCRPSNLREDNLASARRWIERCLDKRDDLSEEHRAGLKKILAVFKSHPEDVFDRLGELRQSFVAPVPGLLGERIGPQ